DWRPGLLLSGPERDDACGATAGRGGEPVPELKPGRREVCLVASAQATTPDGTRILVAAVAARFHADGTVADVTEAFLIRSNGGEPGVGALNTNNPNLLLAWLSAAGPDDWPATEAAAIWLSY